LFQNLKSVREAGLGILLVEQNAKQSLASPTGAICWKTAASCTRTAPHRVR
jgi:ABC-type branched-subunit amino acid transport system ATPase component